MEIINGTTLFSSSNNINIRPNTNIISTKKISCLYDSFSNTTNIETYPTSNDEPNNETSDDININIYRYKFTNEFTDELFKFSKIHQYENRHDFKESWLEWIEDNDTFIDEEVRRLSNLGYDGDIMDKMFKSARYYFRKKSTEKKQPIKRRKYIAIQKNLLDCMDIHINKNIHLDNFKPSEGFDDFCKSNTEILKEEVLRLYRESITDSNEIKCKIKKTYKNRYFLIINK